MNLNLIFYKLNSVFSKLVPFLIRDNGPGPAQGDAQEVDTSSVSNFFKFISEMFVRYLGNILEGIIKLINTFIYVVCRLCLNIIDFLAVFVREFMGVSSIDNLSLNPNLEEIDIIFRFIFSDVVQKVMVSMFALSAVLLIIFTIIAIVKNIWASATDEKDKPVGQIIAKSLRAVFVMIMVPVMVVFGIIFSNVILVSILNTMTPDAGNLSIGGEIFTASSHEANQYRIYASNNNKIPILYDFSGGFRNAEKLDVVLPTTGTSSQIEQEMQALKNSNTLYQGLTAAVMMYKEKFYDITDITDANTYYSLYDGNIKTKQIEYYVMADFVDYALRTGYTFYFKNVEDIYNSIQTANSHNVTDDYKQVEEYISDATSLIHAYDKDGKLILSRMENNQLYIPDSESVQTYKFNVSYNNNYTENEYDIDSAGNYTYSSMQGTYDEIDGTKYMICMSIPYKYKPSGSTYEFVSNVYIPLTRGDVINGIKFNSYYLNEGSPFVARGMFTNEDLPTAIRENGSVIEFYRQNVDMPTIFDFFPKIVYEQADDSSAFTIVTGVNASNLIPKLIFRLDFLTAFTKVAYSDASLLNGAVSVNYNFNQPGYQISNLYKISKIDVIILIYATVIIFAAFIKIMIGLIGRIYELLLLYLTFPAFASSYPIDDGSRFKKWRDNFVQRVFATYSIFITLSIVLLLIPIINNLEFFNGELTHAAITSRIFNYSISVDVANFVARILFTLVLFTMVTKGPALIQEILNANTGKNYDVLAQGDAIQKSIKNVANKAFSYTSLGAAVNTARKLGGDATGMVPGGGLMKTAGAKGVNVAGRMRRTSSAMSGIRSTNRRGPGAGRW